jgi:hypothetical protein
MMRWFSLQLPMSKNIAPLRDLPDSSKFRYEDRNRRILNLGIMSITTASAYSSSRNSLCESEETDARVRMNLFFFR